MIWIKKNNKKRVQEIRNMTSMKFFNYNQFLVTRRAVLGNFLVQVSSGTEFHSILVANVFWHCSAENIGFLYWFLPVQPDAPWRLYQRIRTSFSLIRHDIRDSLFNNLIEEFFILVLLKGLIKLNCGSVFLQISLESQSEHSESYYY